MVLRRHLDVVEEELSEGWVAIEDVGALGVDIEDVQGVWALGELSLNATEKLLQHRRLEWMEEEQECWLGRKLEVERILLHDFDRCKARGGGIVGVGASPEHDVLAGSRG